jgi:hypothetical protein
MLIVYLHSFRLNTDIFKIVKYKYKMYEEVVKFLTDKLRIMYPSAQLYIEQMGKTYEFNSTIIYRWIANGEIVYELVEKRV